MVRALPRPVDLAGHSQRPLHCCRIPYGLVYSPPCHKAPFRPALKAIALLLLALQAQRCCSWFASTAQHAEQEAQYYLKATLPVLQMEVLS